MPDILIPYKPRNWAKALHVSLKRFSAIILHRRAGKTTAVINHHLRASLDDQWERRRLLFLQPTLTEPQLKELINPPGGRHYGHIMPARNQAKVVVWDKLKYYAQNIPGAKPNESELLLRLPNGHKVQLFGADDPDALRGLAFSGLSFDEYSQQQPNIFSEVLSKALADHLGYAIFLGTIKGKDHLYQTHAAAQNSPDWFALWQDIDRSIANEDGITIQLLQQAMEDDRKLVGQGLMTQDEFDQEWYLSADAAIQGAWYAKEMATVRLEGRITRAPIERGLPVDTDWDLGIDDSTAIVFSQALRSGEIRIVDYYEANGEGFPHYIAKLAEKGYVYGQHHPPHDIAVRELGTGKSRKETAAALGLRFQDPMPALPIADGINAARLLLAQCWFDEGKTGPLIESLRNYRKAFNTRLGEFTGTPVHDRHCVTADTKVLTRSGTHQIQYLPCKGEVLTSCGWKRYEHPRITRRNAPLVEVVFEDGLTVRCTPEHRFLTESGWSYASSLKTGSVIRSGSIPWCSISTGVFIASTLKHAISAVPVACIGWFGRARLALFQTVTISIIETGIHPITSCLTWNAYQQQSIFRPSGISIRAGNEAIISRQPQEPKLLNGTHQKQGGSGTVDTLGRQRTGRSGVENPGPVFSAERPFRRWFGKLVTLKNIATTHAKPLRIAHVRPLDERQDVWCLTVPSNSEWALENGAITHNSHGADAFRTLAVRYKVPQIEAAHAGLSQADVAFGY